MKFAGYEITEMTKGEIEALVPPIADPLMTVLSLDEVLALMEALGGAGVWIPTQPTDEHPIARIVGPESFERLRSRFCMSHLWIQFGHRLRDALRDGEIRQLHGAGHSVASIARKLNVGDQIVERVINQYRETLASRGISPDAG